MKSRVKAALLTLAVAVALPVVAWTGTFLYWHITIKRAIASIENERPPFSLDSVAVPGRCRSLPYLIEALETSRHPLLLRFAVYQITSEVGATGRPTEQQEWVELMLLFQAHPFSAEDTSDVRQANYQLILAWWKENQAKYHDWWRVWSSRCSS